MEMMYGMELGEISAEREASKNQLSFPKPICHLAVPGCDRWRRRVLHLALPPPNEGNGAVLLNEYDFPYLFRGIINKLSTLKVYHVMM